MSLVQQLADIDRVIDDQEVAEILLSGLPQEYETLVSNLETACMTSQLTSELVRTCLLQEDFRRNNQDNSASAFVSKKNIKKIICHYCHKAGHTKNKCFKTKRDNKMKNSKDGKDHTFLASAFLVSKCNEWFIDSGCTQHMCNDKNMFNKIQSSKNKVKIADNSVLNCIGIGFVILHLNGNNKIMLCDVIYVPDLSANLLSVSKLVAMDFNVTFGHEGCLIFCKSVTSGKPLAVVPSVNGIYKLKAGDVSSMVAHSSVVLPLQDEQSANVAEVSFDIWHRRLGHLSKSGMLALKNGVACGVNFQEGSLEDCVPCLEGKMVAKSFPAETVNCANAPLQQIHTDVCGPMPIASWGGAKYLVTYTDDYSRKTFGYLIKRKSEMRRMAVLAAKMSQQSPPLMSHMMTV
ncbi:hypothetical protein evm_011960 [Chilo suppressalis]|nr:hypothetical protein evm_011960 [Chilo suppressalis]